MKSRTTARKIIFIFFLTALFFSHPSFAQETSNEGLVVVVKISGGLCPYGPCSDEHRIYKTGSHENVNGAGQSRSRLVSTEDVAQIRELMAQTDFQMVRSRPSTKACLADYDGQQFVYQFYTDNGIEVVDSCAYEINGHDPLFETLHSTIGITTES